MDLSQTANNMGRHMSLFNSLFTKLAERWQ